MQEEVANNLIRLARIELLVLFLLVVLLSCLIISFLNKIEKCKKLNLKLYIKMSSIFSFITTIGGILSVFAMYLWRIEFGYLMTSFLLLTLVFRGIKRTSESIDREKGE